MCKIISVKQTYGRRFKIWQFQKDRMDKMSVCYRCGLYVPEKHTKCPHCEHLTAAQAKALGDNKSTQIHHQFKGLGLCFGALSIVIAVILFATYFD
jgi:ribosomal protein L40E